VFLFDDLLLAPVKSLVWLAEKIGEVADREFSDVDVIKQKLLELQLKFEMDEISEADYQRQEAEILARLYAAADQESGARDRGR